MSCTQQLQIIKYHKQGKTVSWKSLRMSKTLQIYILRVLEANQSSGTCFQKAYLLGRNHPFPQIFSNSKENLLKHQIFPLNKFSIVINHKDGGTCEKLGAQNTMKQKEWTCKTSIFNT